MSYNVKKFRCAPSEDSDQPDQNLHWIAKDARVVHAENEAFVQTMRMDLQADLNLCQAHMSEGTVSHTEARMYRQTA